MTTATDTLPEQRAKEALASLWWMPLIRGILLVIFGILMFTQPGATLLSLLWFMSIYWIVVIIASTTLCVMLWAKAIISKFSNIYDRYPCLI